MTSTRVEHPGWCDSTRCTAADPRVGMHLSAPTGLILDDRAAKTATVRLHQWPPAPGDPALAPLLLVEFRDEDEDTTGSADGIAYLLALRPDHARGLAHLLRTVAEQAAE